MLGSFRVLPERLYIIDYTDARREGTGTEMELKSYSMLLTASACLSTELCSYFSVVRLDL